jgi:hypothetical protein
MDTNLIDEASTTKDGLGATGSALREPSGVAAPAPQTRRNRRLGVVVGAVVAVGAAAAIAFGMAAPTREATSPRVAATSIPARPAMSNSVGPSGVDSWPAPGRRVHDEPVDTGLPGVDSWPAPGRRVHDERGDTGS